MQYGDSYVCADCKPVFLQRLREGAALPSALKYGSPGWRFLALVIDGLILWIASYTIGLILTLSGLPQTTASFSAAFFSIRSLIGLVIGFLYYVGFLIQTGATPGKMALGLKVVNADGAPITAGQAVGRYFCVYFLDPITLEIGDLIAFFDDQRRAMHDRICGTRVISLR
jgi:uncharacterized RDD family membrane protein YckC